MDRAAALATMASIIAAFGAAMIYVRIQRETLAQSQGETAGLTFADWLLVGATVVSLLLVMLPIATVADLRIPSAGAASSVILLAGYMLAILAHHRIAFDREFVFWGKRRHGPRGNPEPAERILASIAIGAALESFFHGLVVAPLA